MKFTTKSSAAVYPEPLQHSASSDQNKLFDQDGAESTEESIIEIPSASTGASISASLHDPCESAVCAVHALSHQDGDADRDANVEHRPDTGAGCHPSHVKVFYSVFVKSAVSAGGYIGHDETQLKDAVLSITRSRDAFNDSSAGSVWYTRYFISQVSVDITPLIMCMFAARLLQLRCRNACFNLRF